MQEGSYKDTPRGRTLKVEKRFEKFIWIKWNGGDEEALGSSTNTWGGEEEGEEEKGEEDEERLDWRRGGEGGVARTEAHQRRSHVVWVKIKVRVKFYFSGLSENQSQKKVLFEWSEWK